MTEKKPRAKRVAKPKAPVAAPTQPNAVEVLSNWHTIASNNAHTLINNAKPGSKLTFPDPSGDASKDLLVQLNEDMAKGVLIGAQIVLAQFRNLPIRFEAKAQQTPNDEGSK